MSKKIALPSTQQNLSIARIQDGVVVTKDGGLRMVLLVSAVNFALKSEQEQNALIYQYQNFLNSLTFPIQIVIQSRQLELGGYLAKLKERLTNESNELLQIQIEDYIDFVRKLISLANIMDKKFFIVIPYNPINLKKRGVFDQLFGSGGHPSADIASVEFKRYREELAQRVNIVMGGLAPMGIRSIPLDTQQLIELYYQTYNPEEGNKEKLADEDLLIGSVIETDLPKPPQNLAAPTQEAK